MLPLAITVRIAREVLAEAGFDPGLVSLAVEMCTAPQNLLVPAGGIETDEGHKSFDEVCAGLAGAVGELLGDDARAVELTGAIVNSDVLARVEAAPSLGEVVLESRAVKHPGFPDAVVRRR
ncbi:hypothetical protein [Nonomuraea jabiensis]|uniref:Uncharacterized protein n=1 Tax=Nonomuraea jabiensis TaxID=882448 RepID=A0A7W9LIJ3_9ACTN|nr:hypothetical protein [Nonomuraea jabiensis]MBB5785009.1 hypothetical protein [Nonomuraea jabiensis]